MTILEIAVIWSAFLIGYLVGAWLTSRKHPDPPAWLTLDPQVTEAIVRQAVSDALAEWEDEEEIRDGDEWKRGKAQ
jgi:hypothetical protein